MGLITLAAEFLVQARASGVDFGRTVTLGRQVMFVSPISAAKLLKKYNIFPAGITDEQFYEKQYSSPYMADEFFRALGVSKLETMDFAPYEGATVLQDLNTPIPDNLKESFDTVIDGGTLEHVFNFPVAIRNCMEMLKVGGRLFIITPANNHFGHGFYQFSAELFYRVLCKDNGFEVERMHLAECEILSSKLGPRSIAVEHLGKVYSVTDPANIRDRVLLATKLPVYMVVQARRIANVPIFQQTPQQSDYAATWDVTEASGSLVKKVEYNPRWAKLKHLQLYWLPKLCRLKPFFMRTALFSRSLRNKRCFNRV